jgi:lipoprotein-releasing system permease protein
MSRLPYELAIALRYFRPKRTFVSVITLISIIGVILGVAVLIIVISVMTGFSRQLQERILGFNAHIRIHAETPFSNYEQVMESVRAHPDVKGVAPYILLRALVETQPDYGPPRVEGPVIRGVDPEFEKDVSVLPFSMVPGRGEFDVRGNGVVIGRELAYRLALDVGDRLEIHSVRDLQKMRESFQHMRERGEEALDEIIMSGEYEVRGIFDAGFYEFNNEFIIASLGNAQDLVGLTTDAVQGVFVMLNDPWKVHQVRAQLGPNLGRFGNLFYVSTWQEENEEILDALIVEKNVMFFLLFFITIVAAFGIINSLITFVVQKTREIGILKALGATSRQIMWLFLTQSLLVGIIGVLAGFGLGMLAVTYRNEFLMILRRLTGFELFPAKIYGFSELPALIVPGDILLICGGSLLICVLAGLIPAWNAGRLRPVDALRHE